MEPTPMYVLLVNNQPVPNEEQQSTSTTSVWICRLCACQQYTPVFLDLFPETGEHALVPVIEKYLGVPITAKDRLPTLICGICYNKIHEFQQFQNSCVEAQKVLELQFAVHEENPNDHESQMEQKVQEITQDHVTPQNPQTSPNKLLETVIKDSCILTEESEDYSDSDFNELAKDVSDKEEDVKPNLSETAESAEPRVSKKRKKLVFTIEYIESKLGRKLGEEESAKLKEYISKGQNTKIFEMLIGGGKNQSWSCQYCSEEIVGSPKEVKDHYAANHNADPVFPCQLCDKVCRSVNYYRIHRLSHLAEYPCEVCGKVFKDNSKLVLHRQVHSNKRPHECDICGKTFKRATTVRVHKRTVHGSKDEQFMFTCEMCGKRFKTNFELKKHVDKHPTEDNPLPYQCKYCPERFPDKAQQIMHSNSVHTNEGDFICEQCGKKVKTETALENHVKSHSGIRDLKCHLCDAAFASRYTLNAHVKRHSITEPLFICPYCGKGSKSKANLDQHIRIHTGVRPYTCDVCQAAFKHRSHLKVHMTIHTGEHPFVCSECGKTFRTNKQRTSHMSYVHNNVRNFGCEHCGKAFKTLKDLKIHSTLHTGEKPNVCGECGKAFRVRANYFKHRKIHQKAAAQQLGTQSPGTQIVSILPNSSNGSDGEGQVLPSTASLLINPSDGMVTVNMVPQQLGIQQTTTISSEGVLLFRTLQPQ